MRTTLLWVALAVGLASVPGCDGCGCGQEPGARAASAPAPGTAQAAPSGEPAVPRPLTEVPADDGVRTGTAEEWGMSTRDFVLARARTSRLGEAVDDPAGGKKLEGFTYVTLPRKDRKQAFGPMIDALRAEMRTQKVFSLAKPLIVFRFKTLAEVPMEDVDWEPAVPVVEGTKIEPPLVAKRIDGGRVHTVAYTGLENDSIRVIDFPEQQKAKGILVRNFDQAPLLLRYLDHDEKRVPAEKRNFTWSLFLQ